MVKKEAVNVTDGETDALLGTRVSGCNRRKERRS